MENRPRPGLLPNNLEDLRDLRVRRIRLLREVIDAHRALLEHFEQFMGIAASSGRDNDELVDNLVKSDSVTSKKVELIFRLVDRGRFFPEDEREDNAYKDCAWKSETGDPGPLHISAPCIYANVLEHLELEPGMSFLNVGSGTGYLSTAAGFYIGETGISHGIELYENVCQFSLERIAETLHTPEVSSHSWCTPEIFCGNAFLLTTDMRYDRIYCGALVPNNRRGFFCGLLKVGGRLVMPYGNALQRIDRKTETQFVAANISSVTFSSMIQLDKTRELTMAPVHIPGPLVPRLSDMCRARIRSSVREAMEKTQELKMRSMVEKKKSENAAEENNQQPEMRPVIILGNPQEEEDEDEEENQNERRRHRLGQILAWVDRDFNEVADEQRANRAPVAMRRSNEENPVPRFGHAAHDEATGFQFERAQIAPLDEEHDGVPPAPRPEFIDRFFNQVADDADRHAARMERAARARREARDRIIAANRNRAFDRALAQLDEDEPPRSPPMRWVRGFGDEQNVEEPTSSSNVVGGEAPRDEHSRQSAEEASGSSMNNEHHQTARHRIWLASSDEDETIDAMQREADRARARATAARNRERLMRRRGEGPHATAEDAANATASASVDAVAQSQVHDETDIAPASTGRRLRRSASAGDVEMRPSGSRPRDPSASPEPEPQGSTYDAVRGAVAGVVNGLAHFLDDIRRHHGENADAAEEQGAEVPHHITVVGEIALPRLLHRSREGSPHAQVATNAAPEHNQGWFRILEHTREDTARRSFERSLRSEPLLQHLGEPTAGADQTSAGPSSGGRPGSAEGLELRSASNKRLRRRNQSEDSSGDAKRRAGEPTGTDAQETGETSESMDVDPAPSISLIGGAGESQSSSTSTVRADVPTETAQISVNAPGPRYRIHRFRFGRSPPPPEPEAEEHENAEIDMRDGVAAELAPGVFTSDESSTSDEEPEPADNAVGREEPLPDEPAPPRWRRWNPRARRQNKKKKPDPEEEARLEARNEQIESLKAFHEEFLQRIASLPISDNLRKFLLYEI